MQLGTAEDDLVRSKSRATAITTWASQVVPPAEAQLLQTKLNRLQEQAAQAASASAAEAAAQQNVIERLSQMLTVQQEECTQLQARLQVFLYNGKYQTCCCDTVMRLYNLE